MEGSFIKDPFWSDSKAELDISSLGYMYHPLSLRTTQ